MTPTPKVMLATSLGPGKEYAAQLMMNVTAQLLGVDRRLFVLDGVVDRWGIRKRCKQKGVDFCISMPDWGRAKTIHGRLARMRALSRDWFLDSDCTHLYWHDCDMVPDLDIIPRLLAREKPVVNGFYLIRGQVDTPTLAMVTQQSMDQPGSTTADRLDVSDDLLTCAAYGHGCMLVDRETMERTPYRDPDWYGPEGPGEDVQWCKDTGLPIWVDTSLLVWHVDEDGHGIRPALKAA